MEGTEGALRSKQKLDAVGHGSELVCQPERKVRS